MESLRIKIISALKTIFDPELTVNIYDLGLIYKIDINKNFNVNIDMTLTAPNCPMAEQLIADVENAIKSIPETKNVKINIVFDPPWSQDKLSDAAKLDLGLL